MAQAKAWTSNEGQDKRMAAHNAAMAPEEA
jgi:hypothetical protein